MSNQATRLAEEAKRLLDEYSDLRVERHVGDADGNPVDRKENSRKSQSVMRAHHAAIDALLALVRPAVSEEAVADLYQHSETGRTRVVMRDAMSDCDAAWLPVGALVLARAQSSSKGDEGMQHE